MTTKKKHLLLKSDFSQMQAIIFNYLDNLDPSQLVKVDQMALNGFVRTHSTYGRPTQPVALAGLIWNYKEHTLDYVPSAPIDPIGGVQVALF